MNNIDKTIKHFESLQKRYTTQHNGQMCERVADALEALYQLKGQQNYKKIFEEVEKTLEPTISALSLISETLVDVSKSYIDADRAIIDIRKYLDKAISSRYQLKKVLEEIKKNRYIMKLTESEEDTNESKRS